MTNQENASTAAAEGLADWRQGIDAIDTQMVELLAARFAITHEVGLYKRDNGLPPRDEAREEAQMEVITQKAEEAGLSPDVARSVLRTIIDHVVQDHQALQQATIPNQPTVPPTDI